MSSRKFSRQRLEALYQLANELGTVVFRHDIDFSLNAALKMAYWEQERDVSSIYYLFLDENCPFYDKFAAIEVTKQLEELGHTVGRHVDERKTDISTLKTGKISFHCPTKNVLWKSFSFESAYSPYWRNFYYADSGGTFAYGDPEDAIDDRDEWQISLHPEWWFERGWYHDVPDEVYEAFFYSKKPYFVDSRRGRAVRNGEKDIWAFDPRPWSDNCALWVSPAQYEFVMKRGYAVIDGQRAFPFLQACDEEQGFLRLIFSEGNYRQPEDRPTQPDVMKMP